MPSVSPFQITLPNTFIIIDIIQSFYLSRWKLASSIEKSYYLISHCSIIAMLWPPVLHIMSRRRGQRLQRTAPQNWIYSWQLSEMPFISHLISPHTQPALASLPALIGMCPHTQLNRISYRCNIRMQGESMVNSKPRNRPCV